MKHKIYLIAIIILVTACKQNTTTQEATEITNVSDTAKTTDIIDSAISSEKQIHTTKEIKKNNPLSDEEIKHIALRMIKNLEYKNENNKFVDEGDFYDVKDENSIFIKDLNKDGFKDVIVIVRMGSEGGNQRINDVAVFINNGVDLIHLIDIDEKNKFDYTFVDNVDISHPDYFKIFAKGYKDSDAQCCPSKVINISFKVVNNSLQQVN